MMLVPSVFTNLKDLVLRMLNMMCNVGRRPLRHMQTAKVQMSRHIFAHLDILRLSTYTAESIDSVSEQRRPRLAYVNAPTDQGLHCQQIA